MFPLPHAVRTCFKFQMPLVENGQCGVLLHREHCPRTRRPNTQGPCKALPWMIQVGFFSSTNPFGYMSAKANLVVMNSGDGVRFRGQKITESHAIWLSFSHWMKYCDGTFEKLLSQFPEVKAETKGFLHHPDFFGVRDLVRLTDLFDARVHLGHKASLRNEYMTPYIFGNRLGIDIIDLEQTVSHMQYALNFVAHIAFQSGVILFVTRHAQTVTLVESMAERCGEYAHCRRWKLGTFINTQQTFSEFGNTLRLPDVVVFLSTHNTVFEQHNAVVESAKMLIPTVGIVDTSCDPRLVSYPIPGNDDTLSAIQLYCGLFEKAVSIGKKKRVMYEEQTE